MSLSAATVDPQKVISRKEDAVDNGTGSPATSQINHGGLHVNDAGHTQPGYLAR
jgi:hypothetical protein